MRILITGGAGFVGANLAVRFIRRGDEVSVYDNLSRPGVRRNAEWLQSVVARERIRLLEHDVRDFPRLRGAVGQADVIFHLASQVAVTTSVEEPRHDFETNALGTLNVLEAARSAPRRPIIVFTSTNKVYGKLEGVPVVEASDHCRFQPPLEGIDERCGLDFYSPYGCSKGAADQYVLDYARIYGLRTVVFRMSCIYGPRQFGNEDQGWVAHFVISAVRNSPVMIYGDGKQVRDILYIDDLARAFELAVDRIDEVTGQAFNIGGGPGNAISLLQFLRFLEEKLNLPVRASFSKARPGDQLVYVTDSAKARQRLGWFPEVGKWEGIERLADWVGQNREIFGWGRGER